MPEYPSGIAGANGVGIPAVWIVDTGIHAQDVRARGAGAVLAGAPRPDHVLATFTW